MKTAMSSQIKVYLKNAKEALQKKDYELSLEWCQDVLEEDASNYYAHIFIGKNNASLNRNTPALEAYLKALAIDEENLLAWKGMFQIFEAGFFDKNVLTYGHFFQLCAKYYEILLSRDEPCVELVNCIRAFRKEHETDCERDFLENMIPGQLFAETLGRHFMTPEEVLQKLLNIKIKEENSKVSTVRARNAMGLSPSDPLYNTKLNELAWEIYSKSDVGNIYAKLINVVDDDEKRTTLEEEWFHYKLKVLKSMPPGTKRSKSKELKDMVDDMIIVGHDSNEVWNYYFDWSDFRSLEDFDLNLVSTFIQKFPQDPLANILYAYICSSISKYDKVKFFKNTWGSQTENTEKAEKNGLLKEDDETAFLLETEDDCLATLLDNIEHAQTSILAHRVYANYAIAFEKYADALKYVLHGISLSMQLSRELDVDMNHTNSDMTLNLALIYTHVDSPKNHQTALQLYSKYLLEHPDSNRAKLGKALIYIEQENWGNADELLKDVVSEERDSAVALSHYSWVKMHLGELDESITNFKKALALFTGMDVPSLKIRSVNMWRLANCYIKKYEECNNSEFLDLSFKYLIESIKCTDDFAQGFSTLGSLYATYYNDPVRAFKCFHKSFSINPGDMKAAEYMVTQFTTDNQWDSAALVCQDLIKSQLVKRELQVSNWPYRVLGISYLEVQNPEDSIEWFQAALRVQPEDIESLVGLGQAYLQCGKVESALKVFNKALEIEPVHVYSRYFYAVTLGELGSFNESLAVFKDLLALPAHSQNECFHVSYAKVLVSYAETINSQGFLYKSVDFAAETIETIQHVRVSLRSNNQSLWTLLCRALKLFLSVRSKMDSLPVETIVDIFQTVNLSKVEIHESIIVDCLFDETDSLRIVAKCLVLTCKCAFAVVPFDELPRALKSLLFYNLGTVQLYAYVILQETEYRESALESFKRSIAQQSNMVEAWVGLGISCMDVSYKVSQHCFIRALSLSPKDVDIWYNIAILALKNNDHEFALEIFAKSQSIAPEQSLPRFGMALALEISGDATLSAALFKHSYILSNGKSKIAELFYAKTVLNERLEAKNSDSRNVESEQDFVAILHCLESYLKKVPDDVFAVQCSIIALERLQNFEKAEVYVNKLVAIVEENFSQSNDEKELNHYGVIQSQFARIKLGLSQFDEAVETANLSMGILEEHKNEKVYKDAIVSNYCVLGLAHFFQNEHEKALEYFQNVLNANDEQNSELVGLVCKALYGVGNDDFKELALSELTDFIGANGFTLKMAILIASITLLEENNGPQELKELLKEVSGMIYDTSDHHMDMAYLIDQVNRRLGTDGQLRQQSLQRAVFLTPQNVNVWKLMDNKITYKIGLNNYKQINVVQKSNELARLGNLSKVQRAMFLCPWNEEAVNTLKYCF